MMKAPRKPFSVLLLPLCFMGVLSTGCARDVIPNTDVPDTTENREVLEFVEEYREAMMERDVGALLRLAHPQYFDDNGTPGADDDVDLEKLRAKLAEWEAVLLDIRYDIRYRRVTFTEDDRIFVDYTYSGRFKIRDGAGEDRWARRLSDNRLVLSRGEQDNLLILSGM